MYSPSGVNLWISLSKRNTKFHLLSIFMTEIESTLDIIEIKGYWAVQESETKVKHQP